MNFREDVQKLNISLSEEQFAKFKTYYEELIRVNSVMNLTAITEENEVYIKHFYDSLVLSSVYDFNKDITLCDVGSGAGFPGIPLAIAYPNIKVVIIDALNKRINFLNELVKKLGLSNVVAIHARAEEYAIKNRETFDVVTARAVARLNVLSELCLPLTKVGGVFLAMKGNEISEIDEAKNAIKVLGGEIKSIMNTNLPYEMGARNVIIINKVRNCSEKYPRAFGKIKDKPL